MEREYRPQIRETIQHLVPSATLLINEQSKKMIASGKNVYRLGFGQSPFPIPDSIVRELRQQAHQKDYLPVRGLPALREAVAKYAHRKLSIACTPEDILIGPGSKELIFTCQLAYDATLYLPAPSWVSYAPQASILGKKVVWMPTYEKDDWLLSPNTLRQYAAPDKGNKMLILNYPNNPTGTSYTAKQLQALAAVVKDYGFLVISDEIYGELLFDTPRISLANYYPEGTIISEGLSKWCGAGGWRLGTFIIPKEHRRLLNAMASIASETFSAVSAPVQHAAVIAFKGNEEITWYLQKIRRVLAAIATYAYRSLKAIGITMPPAAGGFYLFPNFKRHQTFLQRKGIHSATQLCDKLLQETGVALLPGSAFGRPEEELTARLSFVDFDGANILDSVKAPFGKLDDAFVKRHCPQITAAMTAIRKWLDL